MKKEVMDLEQINEAIAGLAPRAIEAMEKMLTGQREPNKVHLELAKYVVDTARELHRTGQVRSINEDKLSSFEQALQPVVPEAKKL